MIDVQIPLPRSFRSPVRTQFDSMPKQHVEDENSCPYSRGCTRGDYLSVRGMRASTRIRGTQVEAVRLIHPHAAVATKRTMPMIASHSKPLATKPTTTKTSQRTSRKPMRPNMSTSIHLSQVLRIPTFGHWDVSLHRSKNRLDATIAGPRPHGDIED